MRQGRHRLWGAEGGSGPPRKAKGVRAGTAHPCRWHPTTHTGKAYSAAYAKITGGRAGRTRSGTNIGGSPRAPRQGQAQRAGRGRASWSCSCGPFKSLRLPAQEYCAERAVVRWHAWDRTSGWLVGWSTSSCTILQLGTMRTCTCMYVYVQVYTVLSWCSA